nr:MAG TPA: Lysozyme [Caudoviricetes sp.]
MANFKEAYEILKRLEFSNPSNALHKNKTEEALTWMGIYEKANPGWIGWEKIRPTLRAAGSMEEASVVLYKDALLQADTANFYKVKYWNKIKGEDIKSQRVASEIFIFGVNAGIGVAIKAAQKIVGVTADAVVGEETLKALNSYDEARFDKEFDRAELRYYNKLIEDNPKFRIYANGWRNRAQAV